jgi:hypothetical protein
MNKDILIHPTVQKFREETLKAIIKNEREYLEQQKKILPFKRK